jgi:hypothetical protein
MRASLATGLVLTIVVSVVLAAVFGRGALLPAGVFGALATALQAGAVRALRTGLRGNQAEFVKGFMTGSGLRLVGVVLVAVVVLVDRDRFPPLPTALAYVGVVVPLLFLEVRFIR